MDQEAAYRVPAPRLHTLIAGQGIPCRLIEPVVGSPERTVQLLRQGQAAPWARLDVQGLPKAEIRTKRHPGVRTVVWNKPWR